MSNWNTRSLPTSARTLYDSHILYDTHILYNGIVRDFTDWSNLRFGGSYLTDISGNYILDSDGNRIVVIIEGGTLPFSEWSGRTGVTTTWTQRIIP